MTPKHYERRNLTETVEIRSTDKGTVAYGYAAKFGVRSQNLGGFVEVVAPGAFAKTLAEQDIRGLWNHNEDAVLGRMLSGTLRMWEDETGLAYELDLPDTATGRDVAVLLARGDVTGSSFGFRTIADSWGETESGFPLRTLEAVALRDVGPVTFPAYLDADSAVRSGAPAFGALASFAEARSVPLDKVTAAALAGDLRTAVQADTGTSDETAETTTETTEDEPAAPTAPARPRLAWVL